MQRVCVLLLAISLVVLFGTLMAYAQVETESSATSAPSMESATEPRSNTDGIAPRTLGFGSVDRDGVARFVPLEDLGLKGITFEQYLKLLPDVRRYQITSLELAGTADEKNVKLTATLRINIDEEFGNQWIRVPVEMSEATLTSAAVYSGPGKARFDGQLARATGRRAWLIRGSGNHTLTLPLIRPLRQQEHTRRRLVLTLPAAGSSHVRLRLPGLDFRVDTSAQSGADVSHDSGNTFVDAYGLGVDFKLNWERKPRTSVSRLQLANRTEFLADLSKTPIKLSAKQTITAQQGSFEQLVVTLPKGIRVFDISELRDTAADQLLKDYTFAEAGDATTVTIYLTRPCSETIRLNWDLDPVEQKVPGKITFGSFHVAGASVHTGEVEVIAPAGFEIERLDFLDARRTTVKTTLANNQIATAYQFTSDRFRLMLDIREIRPRFRIDPRVKVIASGDTLTLRAAFRCRVRRGALKQVELHWPGYQLEGWQLPSAVDSEEFQDWELAEITPDGRMVINLLKRQSREFEFALQTTKRLPEPTSADPNPVMPFSLPEIPYSVDLGLDKRWVSTDLVVTEAADVAFDLTPEDDTVIAPFVLRDQEQQLDDPDARQNAFRIMSRNHRFTASVSEQQQEIDSYTTAVVSFVGNKANVQQILNFDIRFRRLDELQLEIPEALSGKVKLSFEGAELPASASPAFARQSIPLPRAVLGSMQLVARFSLDLPASRTLFDLPLISCPLADFETLRLEIATTGALNGEPRDTSRWQQVYSTTGNRAWESHDFDAVVALDLLEDSSRQQQQYSVRQAIVQTAIDGSFRSQAQFRIEGNPEELKLTIPADCQYDEIRWNSRPIEPASSRAENDGQLITLVLPDTQLPGANWLVINFHSDAVARDTWYSDYVLSAPGFQDGVWTDETIWQVMLSGQQILLDFNGDYSARYEWQRDDLIWHRHSPQPKGHSDLVASGSVRSYTMGRLGSNVPLRIQTLHRSLTLLVGAGIALLLGFVMFRQPRARSFAMIGISGLALAIASVVWPIPVEVFVQPALVGFALAIAATVVDRTGQRLPARKRAPRIDELTFIPSKTTPTGSFVSTGSEDRTVVRSAPIPPVSASSTSGAAGT